jgi:hypothetical protein
MLKKHWLIFVNEGKPMAKLLRQAASRDLAPEYVRKLLAVFGDETKTFSTTCDRDWENGSTYAGRVTLKGRLVWRAPDLGTEYADSRPFTGTGVELSVAPVAALVPCQSPGDYMHPFDFRAV